MSEFHVNQHLSLRLEQDETHIYVAGERFLQCKYLILHIPISEIQSFDEIDSIDDAARMIGSEREREKEFERHEIPPEVEFWGHCSNLQVWYEYGYDTRLIHSNLAFPLLKRLTEVGDTLAKEVFKAEILKRYRDGSELTRGYLANEGFLEYLTDDEKLNCLYSTEDFIALTELAEEAWPHREVSDVLFSLYAEGIIEMDQQKIIKLDLSRCELEEFPRAILGLKHLRILYLGFCYIKEIPNEISLLSILEEFDIFSEKLSFLPDSFCELETLKILDLGGNNIEILPKKIGNLRKLEKCNLSYNRLKNLSESIGELVSLKKLNISNNNLKTLPESVSKLKNLEYLDVSGNPLVGNPIEKEKLKKLNIKKLIYK